jgi:hypothetical protein
VLVVETGEVGKRVNVETVRVKFEVWTNKSTQRLPHQTSGGREAARREIPKEVQVQFGRRWFGVANSVCAYLASFQSINQITRSIELFPTFFLTPTFLFGRSFPPHVAPPSFVF